MTPTTAREEMINAAEKIVADQGMRALTFTAVQLAAHQSNKSAATYHFGSREGLLEAVITARMAPVNARRQAMLDAVHASDSPPTLQRAVEMLVLPLAEETLGRPGSYYARFLAQAALDPELANLVQKHLMAESYRQTYDLLMSLSPLPEELATLRTNYLVMFNMVALAAREPRERTEEETTAIIDDLTSMLVAMIEAPSEPHRERGPRL